MNNLEQIKKLLSFPDEDTFYFAQIFQRRKENPHIGSNAIVIKSYCFKSMDYLDSKMDEIITLCHAFHARAHIHLNRRSYKAVSYEALKILAERLQKGEYKVNKGIWEKACGRRPCQTDKKWLIDIDFKDRARLEDIKSAIDSCGPRNLVKTIATIETKNGFHLITRPFNRQELSDKYFGDEIDIHKNSPTVLYYPEEAV